MALTASRRDNLRQATSSWNAVLAQTLHITSLHTEIQGLIADEMDLRSLVRWRRTCKTNYAQATGSLRRTLLRVVLRFFPYSKNMLPCLTETRAVVGGMGALEFILRECSFSYDTLEIFTTGFWYERLLDQLIHGGETGPNVVAVSNPELSSRYAAERDIKAQTVLHLRNGRAAVIYQTAFASACSAISRMPSTPLMAFVTEHTFGCAYPSLTFNHRALLSDLRSYNVTELDQVTFGALDKAGFTFALDPNAWDRAARGAEENTKVIGDKCLRRRFLCPQQARYFGDRGSCVGYIDPLHTSSSSIAASGVPPFGPMVLWRLSTSFECPERCDRSDPLLNEWLVSTATLFLPNRFRPQRGRAQHRLPVQASTNSKRVSRASSV
ncbi:hypothetical protein C8Q76DRAFT_797904 [Earliella scabrosa]|nr:hypothetical protein C8Q76DRAFT_797904 [Earliella scabrosa]